MSQAATVAPGDQDAVDTPGDQDATDAPGDQGHLTSKETGIWMGREKEGLIIAYTTSLTAQLRGTLCNTY